MELTSPRCSTVRTAFCIDRPRCDCVTWRWQLPPKGLARWMQAPTVGNLDALKRRLIQEFVRQVEEPSYVVVFADSDYVGCLRTRKSTSSSSTLFCGSHLLRSTWSTQESGSVEGKRAGAHFGQTTPERLSPRPPEPSPSEGRPSARPHKI